MLIITDTNTGRKYKILPFDDIKEGDFYLLEEGEIARAPCDVPNTHGSFILEAMDMTVCHKCGKKIHVYDALVDHAYGTNDPFCSRECRGY